MSPCEMNLLIAAITNYMYTTLPQKEFIFWNVFFSELSKTMFSMEVLRKVCEYPERHEHHENKKEFKGDKTDKSDVEVTK